MRCLAPAGGFPSPGAVFKSSLDSELVAGFEKQLKSLFDNQSVSICSSGKEAIQIIAQYLTSRGYKKLIMGAYSCPDVVAAAVRGGLKVGLVDINSKTLEPKFLNANPNEDVLLLSNLYGLTDSVAGLSQYKIIDDACQACLSFDGNSRVGSRGLGVLSFGRGKAICAVGGGAIIGFGENPEVYPERLFTLSRLLAYSILEHPNLYWIPSSLPFLKLGETIFEPDYRDSPLTSGQIAAASEAIKINNIESEGRKKVSAMYVSALDRKKVILPVLERETSLTAILTRFPILVPENRDQVYSELVKAGLGASLSYPASLDTLCKGYVEDGSYEGAKRAALQIITLPTHRYVSEKDINRAAEIIKRYA